MTVLDSLREWLRGYDADMDMLTVEQLDVAPDALGIFQTPEVQITQFVDGSRDVKAFYDLFLRAPCQTDGLREDGMERVEALERWVLAQNRARNWPMLDAGRDCYGVFISGSGSVISQTDAESTYHLTIGIMYFDKGVTE